VKCQWIYVAEIYLELDKVMNNSDYLAQLALTISLGTALIALLDLIVQYIQLDGKRKKQFNIAILLLISIVHFGLFFAYLRKSKPPVPQTSIRMSWGAEFLIPKNKNSPNSIWCINQRDSATEDFREGNYKEAARKFSLYVDSEGKYRGERCSDEPEAQIYFRNAEVLADRKNNKINQIVISVPITSKNYGRGISEEILRGVALAQYDWNRREDTNNLKLIIGIVDDGFGKGNGDCSNRSGSNECAKALDVAHALTSGQITGKLDLGKELVAVIGHFSSDATAEVAKIYQDHELVLISPTSTSDRTIPGVPPILNPFIFRTASNDSAAVEKLLDYLESIGKKGQKIERVAIVYEGESAYSLRFQKSLYAKLEPGFRGKTIVNNQENDENLCNLSLRNFDARKCLSYAREHGANALVLIPSTKRLDDIKLDELLQMNFDSRPSLRLIGADSMYSYQLLSNMREKVNGMLVAVPWQRKDDVCDGQNSDSPRLECRAEALFVQPKESSRSSSSNSPLQISWRTATAYDAVNAIGRGLLEIFPKNNYYPGREINDLRRTIQETLNRNDLNVSSFFSDGKLHGSARFENGDRISISPKEEHRISHLVIVEARQGSFKRIDE
jgi:ABC-type branched-subunit amino acid transport system substrate-binding protein